MPGKFHGQRSLAGYGPQGYKESEMTEQLSTHPQTPKADDLITSYLYDETSIKTQKDRVQRAFRFGENTHSGEDVQALCPFPLTLPYAFLP